MGLECYGYENCFWEFRMFGTRKLFGEIYTAPSIRIHDFEGGKILKFNSDTNEFWYKNLKLNYLHGSLKDPE